jgi:hypothetical protein
MAIADTKRWEVLSCAKPKSQFQKATKTIPTLNKVSAVSEELYVAQKTFSVSCKPSGHRSGRIRATTDKVGVLGMSTDITSQSSCIVIILIRYP